MSDLASIGLLAAGMGQLAGGLGLGAPSSDFSRGTQRWLWSNQIPYMVKGAKAAGIHPLAALGVSPQTAPSKRIGGVDFGQMGAGIRNMTKAGQSEVTKAQIENLEARTKLINKQAEQIGKESPPGQVEADPTGVIKGEAKKNIYDVVPKQVQRSHGLEVGREGFGRVVNMPDGGTKVYPSQSLQESTSEGYHAIEYGISQINKFIRGNSFDLLYTPKAIEARNLLRKQKMELDKDIPKDMEHRYDTFRMTWYKYKRQNRLFTSPALRKFVGDTYEKPVMNWRLEPQHKQWHKPTRQPSKFNRLYKRR